MYKTNVTWKGKEYPVREIMLNGELGEEYDYPVMVSTAALWDAIENDFYAEDSEAIDIDSSIIYYCEEGFIESNPTDEEISDYLNENMI